MKSFTHASRTRRPLELVLSEPPSDRPRSVVVMPQLPGVNVEPLTAALMAGMPGARRLVLPAPSADAPVAALRSWHRDAWMALSGDIRSSVALVTGPTATYLAPVLETATVVAPLAEPLAAMQAAHPKGLPEARQVAKLARDPSERRQRRLRPWSNPQSRALLRPWHDPEQLPVTARPPDDAEHWRTLLFDDVLALIEVGTDAVEIARRLAPSLGIDARQAARAVRRLRSSGGRCALGARDAELLRSLSWLDVELYRRCSAPARLLRASARSSTRLPRRSAGRPQDRA